MFISKHKPHKQISANILRRNNTQVDLQKESFKSYFQEKIINMSSSAIAFSYVKTLKKNTPSIVSKSKKWNGTAKEITTTIVNNKPTTKHI